MGKSTHIKHHIKQRLDNGEGFLLFDLHGDDIYDIIDIIPKKRLKQTFLYDLTQFPLALNPLADVDQADIPTVASAFADIIKTTAGYDDIATPRIFNNVYFPCSALMEYGGTLVDVPRMLLDRDFRDTVLDSLKDMYHKDIYWTHFNNRPGKEQSDYIDSTAGQFHLLVGDPRIRQSIGQTESSFSVSDILETNGVFLARIPQGHFGLNRTRMIVSFILSLFHLKALRRESKVPFYFYLDEGHHFPASTVREILSGARKFGINLVFAHQYVDQLTPALFSALAGNCDERHVFRVSRDDAAQFERQRGRNEMLCNLYELEPFKYRKFTLATDPVDATVDRFDPARFADNRRYIEETMRRNYVR